MLLWVLFAALAAAAALAIARPFLFVRTETSGGMASAIYRAQLAELRQETEAGAIAAADAEEARREIARRLLAADEAEKKAARPGLKRETAIGLGLTLIVPVAALILYVALGRPDLPGQPLASRDAFGNTAPESTGLVEAKREHKADGCPAVYAVFEDPGQRIKMDEDLFPGEGFDLQ